MVHRKRNEEQRTEFRFNPPYGALHLSRQHIRLSAVVPSTNLSLPNIKF